MKPFKIDKADYSILDTLKCLWPLEINEVGEIVHIYLGHDKKEIWAFPLIGGSSYLDETIHSLEEHRKVIPAALNRCLEIIDGTFLVGYFIKPTKNDEYQHGIIIIPANRDSKESNSRLLTDYCFEREELYNNMLSQIYFTQINCFLNAYKSICKKYWIQDTKLINTSFKQRPSNIDEESESEQPAVSTWNTEIYPDFMRPIGMIGDIYIDFMICNHKLVSLQNEFDENDSIWDLFEEEGINQFYSLPTVFENKSFKNQIEGWCETTSFELSRRKDFDYNTLYDISVPGLKGTIVNQGISIGWCGKLAFMCIGIDKPLYISPEFIRKLSNIDDFQQAGYDNKAYWRNRDIEYRRHFGNHILVKVSDDLLPIPIAKKKLKSVCENLMKNCKKPLKEVQKGLNKFVLRYLKGLARGPEETIAADFINKLNAIKIYADEQEILDQIIKWLGNK